MNTQCVCQKDEKYCLCAEIAPIENHVPVVILRHPQEKKKNTNTAVISKKMFTQCEIKTGLSWKNLRAATGSEKRNWGVLYPGSRALTNRISKLPVGAYVCNRDDVKPLKEFSLDGIIAIDGNWAQAKTLWWRNPWIKRLARVTLNHNITSAFSDILREPRKIYRTTAESIAYSLEILENRENIVKMTTEYLEKLKARLKE